MAWRHNLGGTAWHPSPPTATATAAAAPPPGWKKTPLFVEISALKQQVTTLAAENARLSGLAHDSTETCGHLSKEVGRLKQAFSALADLVDAEVGRLEADGTRVRGELATLAEGLAALRSGLGRTDDAHARERERATVAAGRVDEWMRSLAGEVEDLREDAAAHAETSAREVEKREEAEKKLRRDLAEVQPPLLTLQYNVAACALELQRQQEELQRQQEELQRLAEAEREAREARERSEAAAAGAREEAHRERTSLKGEVAAREQELARALESKLAETHGALVTIERRIKEQAEASAGAHESGRRVLERADAAEAHAEALAQRVDAAEQQLHEMGAARREQAEATSRLRTSTASTLDQHERSLQSLHADVRALRAKREAETVAGLMPRIAEQQAGGDGDDEAVVDGGGGLETPVAAGSDGVAGFAGSGVGRHRRYSFT